MSTRTKSVLLLRWREEGISARLRSSVRSFLCFCSNSGKATFARMHIVLRIKFQIGIWLKLVLCEIVYSLSKFFLCDVWCWAFAIKQKFMFFPTPQFSIGCASRDLGDANSSGKLQAIMLKNMAWCKECENNLYFCRRAWCKNYWESLNCNILQFPISFSSRNVDQS